MANRVPEASVESSVAAVEWAAVFAGALGAIGFTIILFAFGSALGFSAAAPWSLSTRAPTEFGLAAGIWMIVMQWLSAALGGYLTGRMRTKWVGIRTDEVFFRDTAHGFFAWALATVVMALLVTLGSAVAASVVAATAPDAAAAAAPPAEQVRQVAVGFSFFTALSLLIGAFIGAAAGALGGFHRDEA